MSRFRKGTTDHDGDGRMGGSRKENDMTKAPAKKAAAKPDPQSGMDPSGDPDKAAVKKRFEKADNNGEPTQAEIDEATLSRSIRGW